MKEKLTDAPKGFGARLEWVRQRMEVPTKAEFARLIGVDRQLLDQWVKKKRCSIDAENLARLARATKYPQEFWTEQTTLGVALVDEVEDSPADSHREDVNSGEALMEDPIAQTALTLLMKLPPRTALKVIEEVATRLSAKQKESLKVPFEEGA
jgi:transcriptional regulator with XRE-family HTH domain